MFHITKWFKILQRMQNMQSSPLLLGRKRTIIRYSILSWSMIIVPKGSHSPKEADCLQLSCPCPKHRECATTSHNHGFLCPTTPRQLGDIWSLHLYRFLWEHLPFNHSRLLSAPRKQRVSRRKLLPFMEHLLCDATGGGTLYCLNTLKALWTGYDHFAKEISSSKR